jgi:uncharacterized protein
VSEGPGGMTTSAALLPFNIRRFERFSFVSNDIGESAFLDDADARRLIAGQAPADPAKVEELRTKAFIAGGMSHDAYAERYWNRRTFIGQGPILHGLVLTERCNLGCQYCHSSVVGMDRTDTDMSASTAEKCVDFALQTTSPALTIEFQGGEPMANWPVLQHTVAYAQKANLARGKTLSFTLVTNMTLMDEERLDFLIGNRVQICTSIDGPADLHDRVRIMRGTRGGSSFEHASKWIRRVNERYQELGLDHNLYHAEALPTITRHSLSRWKDIIDTFVDLGCRAVFLRILDPFGFAAMTNRTLGYTIEEYLEFYEHALDYICALNRQGVQIMERLAAIMLGKMLAEHDPNYLDLRSPGGCVIGQLAYHPNGDIYSSDEGRMVAAMGDPFFRLGNVADTTYGELMASESARALVLASTNDQQPGCASCAYKPFCGQQPEYNYVTQGSIHGRMIESTWCRKHMGIFDMLARRLRDASPEDRAMYERWTINRHLERFIQPIGGTA